MSKYVFLTGATGLVGRYLMRDLLDAGHLVAVLVRPGKKESATARVESIMQMWEHERGRLYPRPVCIQGDVATPGLGISSEDRTWLQKYCRQILHNAAVLQFTGSDRNEEPWKTNVQGTKHLLNFAEELQLRHFDYVSTAYVCGKRRGPIREDEFDCRQEFRNDYEASKFESERLVRENSFIDTPTIFRPAVIAGDSVTAYTNTYHGIYVYMRLISTLLSIIPPEEDGRRHTPFRAPVTGQELRNVVCVDWVSQAITSLLGNPEARGRTFHLTPDTPMTGRDLFDAGQSYFNSYGVEYVGPNFDWPEDLSIFEQAYQLDAETYREYEVSDPIFDKSNLRQFFDVPSPVIDEAMLHRFWRFGEDNRWGKKRATIQEVARWADKVLGGLSSETQEQIAKLLNQDLVAGLDVRGPGGGQFQLHKVGHRVRLDRGLPLHTARILETNMQELESLLSS